MAITGRCPCGATIHLPDSAAGRRARCRSCGQVFRVPGVAFSPAAAPATAGPAAPQPSPDIELAPSDTPAQPRAYYDMPMAGARGVEGDWIEPSERSFWGDAAWSFVFFLDAGNLVTLLALCLLRTLTNAITTLSFMGIGMFLLPAVSMLFTAWLWSFYVNIVVETARGEDGLPNVWVTSLYEDIILPAIRFMACWLVVLLPAGIAAMTMVYARGDVAWNVVAGIAAVGLFFWPVMVLGAALGEGLPLASIPMLILTVLRAFAPYVAVCVLVAIAAGIAFASQRGLDLFFASPRGANISAAGAVGMRLLAAAADIYAWIVAMRLIGLYYRHFKTQFPWKAE